jgi:hypothetical protein
MSPEQEQYVAYHSPEQRAARMMAARLDNEAAVSEAHALYFSGDVTGAEDRLFSAGISPEGIWYYMDTWGSKFP